MIRNWLNTLVLIVLLLAPAVLLSVYAPSATEQPAAVQYETVITDTAREQMNRGR